MKRIRSRPLFLSTRSTVALRAVAEGRRDRGDAAGALTALEELARLEPGNAESRSKAAAAQAPITPGR